jgi:ABC-type Zn uptake system ZnuABC Zn-binding protein ZnuA
MSIFESMRIRLVTSVASGGLTRDLRVWLVSRLVAYMVALVLAAAVSCARPEPADRTLVATIPPLGAILRELAQGRAEVKTLLKPGASPHTYEPSPSDAKAAETALGLFFVDSSVDGWATRLAQDERIGVFVLLPEELKLRVVAGRHPEGIQEHDLNQAAQDAHFWTSPRAVKALLPALTQELSRLDPGGASIYRENADKFAAKLDALDAEVGALLAPVKGESVLLFHPSFQYLLMDYGLNVAAVVEPSPGKEPTPRLIADLAELAREQHLKAVFTEPQLPEAPVRVISEEAHLPVFALDPLGGQPGRDTYEAMVRYNAQTLAEALQ